MLDAERDAFFFSVNVEDFGFDHVAFGVGLNGFFAGLVPSDVIDVDHAVEVRAEADKHTELGNAANFAFDFRSDRAFSKEGIPWIVHSLLEAEGDAALLAIDIEHFNIDKLRG